MATPVCAKCGVPLAATARFCPSCGKPARNAIEERPVVGIVLLSLALGALSGAVLSMVTGMLIGGSGDPRVSSVVLFGGWAATSYYLIKHSRSVGATIRVGALVGAVEWLVFGLVSAGSVTVAMEESTVAGSTASTLATGLGLMTVVVITIVMVILCLLVYGIARFAQREARDSKGQP